MLHVTNNFLQMVVTRRMWLYGMLLWPNSKEASNRTCPSLPDPNPCMWLSCYQWIMYRHFAPGKKYTKGVAVIHSQPAFLRLLFFFLTYPLFLLMFPALMDGALDQ